MSSASRTGRCGSSSKTKRVILTSLRADKSSRGGEAGGVLGAGIISPKLKTAKVPPASGVTPINERESVKKRQREMRAVVACWQVSNREEGLFWRRLSLISLRALLQAVSLGRCSVSSAQT